MIGDIDHPIDRGWDRGLMPHLEAFVEVARRASVRRASEVLRVGQPALSARIAALEHAVGGRLFERSRSGMILTPAGRAFLPHAERAVASVTAGIGAVGDVARGLVEELTIGAAPAVSAYVLPELIARLRRREPGVRALVRTGHSEEVVALVAAGDVDLGLVREIRDPRVSARPLFEEELVLVARPDHPFSYEGRIEVERLSESVLILFDRTSSYYDITHGLFREAGIVPGGTIEVDNIETAKRMTIRGLGVAFLPSTSVADALADGSLVAVRVVGVAPVRRRIIAVERLGRPSRIRGVLGDLLGEIPTFIPGSRPLTFEE
ncbi:MAG TPA: LysR family transcriptional regulator [Candidatus Limnocylindrales bacterium]